jgi:predicted DNA-binding transcriptional regulator
MKFQDWKAKDVELRILEMADTLRKLPAVRGPKAFGNAMPEPVRSLQEVYGSHAARYRENASAGSLGRMEHAFGWINALESQPDRKLIYAWSWVKVRKGMKISAFAGENDLNERTLRRAITAICQGIADSLNQKGQFRLAVTDLQVSEIQPDIASQTVTSESCVTYWRAADGRPQIDPALPSRRVIEPRQARAR